MTYTFDPRHSRLDDAASLDRFLIEREAIPAKPTVQQTHLKNLGQYKTDMARHRCLICGLELAIQSNAKFCVSCGAQRRLGLQRQRRKVHRAFVGKVKGMEPKPPELT